MNLTYEEIKAKQDADRLMHQWWTLQSETERQDTVRGISGCLEYGLTRSIARMPEAGKLAVELAYARHCKHVAELEAAHPEEPAPTRCKHVRGFCNCKHAQTPWVAIKAYGGFYRISEDGLLEAQAMMKDGSMAPIPEDGPMVCDPMAGVDEPVIKLWDVIEDYLKNPNDPKNAAIAQVIADPDALQGPAGDVLPVLCEECHIRFGDQCEHF